MSEFQVIQDGRIDVEKLRAIRKRVQRAIEYGDGAGDALEYAVLIAHCMPELIRALESVASGNLATATPENDLQAMLAKMLEELAPARRQLAAVNDNRTRAEGHVIEDITRAVEDCAHRIAAEMNAADQRVLVGKRELERLQQLEAVIKTPMTEEFLEAVRLEAAYQVSQWKADDRAKTHDEWYFTIGYLLGKALHNPNSGEHSLEKRLHRMIASAATIMNWHAYTKAQAGGGTWPPQKS